MPRSRDYLPFPRGTTASAMDVQIMTQVGAQSVLPPAGQTSVGGPGQAPTTTYPFTYPYREDLFGFVGDTVDTILGTNMPMQLRAMQYIPTSGSAYLVLDGHALGLSTVTGWQQTVVTGIAGATGAMCVLPDPAYFMGRSIPVYVKPYDWFLAVEFGPAVGIISTTLGAGASLMTYSTAGTLAAATATYFNIGTSDGNGGNSVTTSGFGYGQYVIPAGNAPALGSVNTSTGVGTAGTVYANHYAPVPSGVTANGKTAAATTGRFMPSGGTYNASNLILLYVKPGLWMPEA